MRRPWLLLLPVLSLTLQHHSTAAADAATTDAGCQRPATCGNLTIDYPFWVGSTQATPSCGPPAFQISCNNNTAASLSVSYIRVLDIDYASRSLVAVHVNVAAGGGCNTLFNVSSAFAITDRFRISASNRELYVLYNCAGQPPPGAVLVTNCNGTNSSSNFAYLGGSYGTGRPPVNDGRCEITELPVLGSEAEGATSDSYRRLIRAGFRLEWEPVGDCNACSASGGRCRYDNKTAAFACLCSDGSLRASTCDGKHKRRLPLIGKVAMEGLVGPVCHANTFVRAAGPYDESGNDHSGFLEGCSATVLPVLGGSDKVNASRYLQLISDGFLLTWQPSSWPTSTSLEGKSSNRRTISIVLLAAAAGSLLLACIYVLVWHRKGQNLALFLCKRPRRNMDRNIEALISSHGSLAPKRYKYAEIMRITSSFNNKLGEGGYGVVFKGTLNDGRVVAVKLLHDSKANGEEFVNEVMSIGKTSHVNIVSLFGFCFEGSKRALIYEYMPNGSLDKYIYSENPKSILGWEKLYGIAVGIARGLEYLHHSCNTRIVHFDIKPQNILLDQNFCPKIADFGLAKLCHAKESRLSMTGARGTIGFIAPEVHSRTFGIVSTKSDVYSYGMMLLEMIGGRKNVKSVVDKSSQKYFPEWIYDHFAQDDGLQACEVTQEVEEISKKMILIGLWCVQILPMHRPTITKVLEMFERGSAELDMPPKQNFDQILEDSNYNLSAEGTGSNPLRTQVYSEVVRIKQESLPNSKTVRRLPTL